MTKRIFIILTITILMISILNVPKVKAINSYALTMRKIETLISIDDGEEVKDAVIYKYMANEIPAYIITDGMRRKRRSKWNLS